MSDYKSVRELEIGRQREAQLIAEAEHLARGVILVQPEERIGAFAVVAPEKPRDYRQIAGRIAAEHCTLVMCRQGQEAIERALIAADEAGYRRGRESQKD